MRSHFKFAVLAAILWVSGTCIAEEKQPAPKQEEVFIVPNPNAGQLAQAQQPAQAQAKPAAAAPAPQANPQQPVAAQGPFPHGQIPGTLNMNRKPGDPIIIGNGTQTPQLQQGVVAQNNQAQNAERSQAVWNFPVLRLPIDLPSSSISSVGTGFGRFQVAQDAQLETREIVVPLAGYWPYAAYLPAAQPQNAAPAGQNKP